METDLRISGPQPFICHIDSCMVCLRNKFLVLLLMPWYRSCGSGRHLSWSHVVQEGTNQSFRPASNISRRIPQNGFFKAPLLLPWCCGSHQHTPADLYIGCDWTSAVRSRRYFITSIRRLRPNGYFFRWWALTFVTISANDYFTSFTEQSWFPLSCSLCSIDLTAIIAWCGGWTKANLPVGIRGLGNSPAMVIDWIAHVRVNHKSSQERIKKVRVLMRGDSEACRRTSGLIQIFPLRSFIRCLWNWTHLFLSPSMSRDTETKIQSQLEACQCQSPLR